MNFIIFFIFTITVFTNPYSRSVTFFLLTKFLFLYQLLFVFYLIFTITLNLYPRSGFFFNLLNLFIFLVFNFASNFYQFNFYYHCYTLTSVGNFFSPCFLIVIYYLFVFFLLLSFKTVFVQFCPLMKICLRAKQTLRGKLSSCNLVPSWSFQSFPFKSVK